MSDADVSNSIESLVSEEHELLAQPPSDERHERLEAVKVELDRCWDLLRQRRAREEFGQDPDEVQARPADVVENYEQ
jgi:phage tail sheath gpL-like